MLAVCRTRDSIGRGYATSMWLGGIATKPAATATPRHYDALCCPCIRKILTISMPAPMRPSTHRAVVSSPLSAQFNATTSEITARHKTPRFMKNRMVRCGITRVLSKAEGHLPTHVDFGVPTPRRVFHHSSFAAVTSNDCISSRGQAARTKPVFPGASVSTPLRIQRLPAHFSQKRSEIEGRVRVSGTGNCGRSMQPTRLSSRAN